MSQACQAKVQTGFEKLFGRWAEIVSKKTTIVFCVSFAVFFGLCCGMTQSKKYENEQLVWTPGNNQSLQNKERSEALFDQDEDKRVLSIIATSDNLLTVNAFKELLALDEAINAVTEYTDSTFDDAVTTRPKKGTLFSLKDVCQQWTFNDPTDPSGFVNKCFNTGQPLDFIYEVGIGYPLSKYPDDASLLAKIKQGISDPAYRVLRVNSFLSGSVPEEFEQNSETGLIESIESAKAAQYSYFIENARNEETIEVKETYAAFEKELQETVEKFNESSEYVKFEILTTYGLNAAFKDDLQSDLKFVQIAIMLVATYTILVLGTFSGMHCRIVLSLMGLLCVGLAYGSGFGICYLLGGEVAGVHNLMPFLLIGIGVDDMFVICNAIDQTDLKANPHDRIIEAMKHAGPSITITSLTNTLAFAFGGLNSLLALRSFCLFAAACVFMIYLIVMTVFLSVVVWDTERVGRKKGECCGLCMCKQDSVLCCKGYFLSKKMIEYGQLSTDSEPKSADKKDEVVKADENPSLSASKTEKCLELYLAPNLLSWPGRISIIVIYVILIAGSIIGCALVEIDFNVRFFIGEESYIYNWFELNDQYFSVGSTTTTYVDNDQLDYSSLEVQKQMDTFNKNLEECTGCVEKWNLENTLKMWYDEFLNEWFSKNLCSVAKYDDNYVPQDKFYPCLKEFLATDQGRTFKKELVITGDLKSDFKIIGYRQTITVKIIDEIAKQGVNYLNNIRDIEDEFGLDGTFSYAQDFLDYELYFVFVEETLLSTGLSVIAVFLVVLFITGSLPVTVLVVIAVLLVDLFLVGLVHFWDLTFNVIIVIQIVIAIGLAVDYSAHIAHTYLIVQAPTGMSNGDKRAYKASKALSSMGSSVFHGGFSTFLAIIALSDASSYIFVVFFRMWFGIIVFGMANGFLLLPVILSICGPLGETTLDLGDQTPQKQAKLTQVDKDKETDRIDAYATSEKDVEMQLQKSSEAKAKMVE